jgi:beta-lactamase regulating signal transducer with metallopeptidase domain
MFGVVGQARRVQVRLQALAQLNLELAKIEGKRRAIALGIAVGLAVAARVLLFYAIGFLFSSAAVALNAGLALWLSLLVVAGAILVVAVIAVVVARSFAKKVSSPSPAVDEAERTVETLRTHA